MSLPQRLLTVQDLPGIRDKRLLLRLDLNVPLQDGRIRTDARLRMALPAIHEAQAAGAGVLLASHLGRPPTPLAAEDRRRLSLAPVAEALAELLDRPVPLIDDVMNGAPVQPGQVVLLENLRFQPGEVENDPALAARMASWCDIFVMDAFAVAHRVHASTCGVAEKAPLACAGPLMLTELEALGRVLENPRRPLLAVVGGAKVSSKLKALAHLARHVDQLVVGGGLANTFLVAEGHQVGRSLHEPRLLELASELLASGRVVMPEDVQVMDPGGVRQCAVDQLTPAQAIRDIGPASIARLKELVAAAGTVLWSGPMGVFEEPDFAAGTSALAQAIAGSDAFTLAGGGDTLAALEQFGVSEQLSYVSSGGGAFLAALEGTALPVVQVLERRARDYWRCGKSGSD